MSKTKIYLNSNYQGDYVTTSTGHIFYKQNAKVVNKPKDVYLEDVKTDEVENLLSQNILVTSKNDKQNIGKKNQEDVIVNDEPVKGVKEKLTKKTKKDNEEIINELTDE